MRDTDYAYPWDAFGEDVERPPIVVLAGVGKSFDEISVLRDIDLEVVPGEIHAIMGENGAGKSTLVKVLSGVLEISEGTIQVAGQSVRFQGPRDAENTGIVIIHQELSLVPEMSVAANVTLGHEPLLGGLIIDRAEARRRTSELLTRFGFRIDPDTPVKELRVGEQQLVEIARALLLDARVLIMDEPTSALSQVEAEMLKEVIRDLALQDVAILYISHRMDEVFEIADRITVLRDGNLIGSSMASDVEPTDVVEMMVGRKIEVLSLDRHYEGDSAPALEVVDITVDAPDGERRLLNQVSLKVAAGEIVGIAGLLGAGRSELLETIFGARGRGYAGEIRVNGTRADIATPMDGIAHGLAFITEDRKNTGLVLDGTITDNIALPSLSAWSRFWLPSSSRKQAATLQAIEDLSIRCRGPEHLVRQLSGGNQQKVVLGKWLATNPKVLLLDEPTRGIDIGAKDEIYQLIGRLADDGIAILMASSEVPELMAICERVVVLCEGRVTGELMRDHFSADTIKHLSMQFW